MTDYIILRLKETVDGSGAADSGTWKEYGAAPASSPAAALRSFGQEVLDGTYVAVPKRSWKPLTVSLQRTTKVTIG